MFTPTFRQDARRASAPARMIQRLFRQFDYDITLDGAELLAYFLEMLIVLIRKDVSPNKRRGSIPATGRTEKAHR
jgi:hypothetical protein